MNMEKKMPVNNCEYKNESPRIRAWQRHYEAKGCHPMKAYDVACEKVRRKGTWPLEGEKP